MTRITITGVQNVMDLLGRKARAVSKTPRVLVGYSAPYAIYVHENLQAVHPNGQAKFLEQPSRTEEARMRSIILVEMRAGKTLQEAMLASANYLKAASQALCPVDTGFLRDSAFAYVVDASNQATSNVTP